MVFTSFDFSNYYTAEGIKQVAVTTGVPRGNGQEALTEPSFLCVLTKLSLGNFDRWYKHVAKVQLCLSTYQRSVGVSSFKTLFVLSKNEALR